MARLMYDSVTAHDIPANAPMVAGYVTGRYAWTAADWARFPDAARVEIATSAVFVIGDVLDVEAGDATPAQAPDWIDRRRAAGLHRPTIYCPKTSMNTVLTFCSEAGLAVTHDYDLWVASWTGAPHAVAPAAAVQYANPDTSGGHYDLSLVVDDAWPHRTPPQGDPDMTPEEHNMLVDNWNRLKNLESVAHRDIDVLQPMIQQVLDDLGTPAGVDAKAVADELARRLVN